MRAQPPRQLLSPPHPTPPRDLCSGVDGRGGRRNGAGASESWVGWARTPGGGRVPEGAGREQGGGDGESRRPLPGAAAAALDGRPRVGERAGRALPGRHGSSPGRRLQPARVPLPWRPIRARLAGREAARGFYCGAGGGRPRLPVFQPSGLARPPPGETPPRGRPRGPEERRMEPRCPRTVRPARARSLAPLSRSPGASLPPPERAHPASVFQAGARRLGGRRARRTDARAPTGLLRAGGEAGGGAEGGRRGPQLRGSPRRQVAGSLRHLAATAAGLPFSEVPADLCARLLPLEAGAWPRRPALWGAVGRDRPPTFHYGDGCNLWCGGVRAGARWYPPRASQIGMRWLPRQGWHSDHCSLEGKRPQSGLGQ